MDIKQLIGPALAALPPGALARLPLPVREWALLSLERATARFPRSYVGHRTRSGFQMSGNTRDLIQRYVYVFGAWEPDISAWIVGHLQAGDVVVDIGANVGYVSLLCARQVGPTGRVYAFEAVPAIAALLRENVGLNPNGGEVVVIAKAVSDEPGKVKVYMADGYNLGMSGTDPGHGRVLQGIVEAVRVDDAIDRTDWPRVRLVKIDIEGDELKALAGAGALLDALPQGAAVLVELLPDELARRGASAQSVLDQMRLRGFAAYSVANSYEPRRYLRMTSEPPTALASTPTQSIDALFVKK